MCWPDAPMLVPDRSFPSAARFWRVSPLKHTACKVLVGVPIEVEPAAESPLLLDPPPPAFSDSSNFSSSGVPYPVTIIPCCFGTWHLVTLSQDFYVYTVECRFCYI